MGVFLFGPAGYCQSDEMIKQLNAFRAPYAIVNGGVQDDGGSTSLSIRDSAGQSLGLFQDKRLGSATQGTIFLSLSPQLHEVLQGKEAIDLVLNILRVSVVKETDMPRGAPGSVQEDFRNMGLQEEESIRKIFINILEQRFK